MIFSFGFTRHTNHSLMGESTVVDSSSTTATLCVEIWLFSRCSKKVGPGHIFLAVLITL